MLIIYIYSYLDDKQFVSHLIAYFNRTDEKKKFTTHTAYNVNLVFFFFLVSVFLKTTKKAHVKNKFIKLP